MNLEFFADLLRDYWFILVPLLLITGAESRAKESRARALQVLAQIIGLIAAVLIALGVFGLLIH